MKNLVEFNVWLSRCCQDAENELRLSKEDIVLVLLDKAKLLLALHLAEREQK